MDFSFDFGQIYLVVLCGALALPLLLVGCRFVVLLAEPHLRAWVAQFNYAKPRLGGIGPRVSGSQLSILILYLAINGILLGVGIDTLLELERRAAAIASANLMLVFLGGRTNPLADFMQVPLASYYFGHRWIGIVATCEALLHSGLALSRRQKLDASLVQSGYILAAGGLLAVIVLSIWFRRLFGRFFGLFHLLCSMAALGGLVWHVCVQRSAGPRIPVFVSCALLGSTHAFRLVRMFIFGRTEGILVQPWDDGNIIRLRVATNKPVGVFPGCYFYVFFPGPLPFYDLFHGYAMMPAWSEPEHNVNGKTSSLTFLISRTQGQHCRSLGSILPNQRIRLDGPYGRSLQVHTFETVVLTAKGLGICGVLPIALHLAARRQHDDRLRDKSARLRDSSDPVFGDLSRNVDLIWWLEHDDQDRWVGDQLRALQAIDKRFLVVWCVYPVKRNPERKLPFQENEYWERKYSFDFSEFSRELRQEARYPGQTVVVASGDEKFVNAMREMVIQNTTSNRIIKFTDLEYHTPGSPVDQGAELREMDVTEGFTHKIREIV
ncbi:hypothetical protein NW759_016376 [Fusarium solani]|nr:hypothetical protein NW759_016376 [Fusarium solani]